jgi:branched-subunit amino acid ABC-type transport system permease component
MSTIVGLAFNGDRLAGAVLLGVAAAGLYGFLAVALVLTYRVSRTIGFVMGGIALFSVYLYYWLAYVDIADFGKEPRFGEVPAALMVIAFAAGLGVVYGMTVTGKRMSNWPRIVLTTYSLAGLLTLSGLAVTIIPAEERRVPSPFGDTTYTLFSGNSAATIRIDQVAAIILLGAIVTVLTIVMKGTRTGTYVRAIADDVEACRFMGIRLNRVGTGVYAFSGAIAGLAGVLLASSVGTSPPIVLLVFLRALVVAVLGGFVSLPLALVGCLLLGVGETMLTAGVFGLVKADLREMILMGTIFALVFVINRLRPIRVIEATGL